MYARTRYRIIAQRTGVHVLLSRAGLARKRACTRFFALAYARYAVCRVPASNRRSGGRERRDGAFPLAFSRR